MRRRGGRAAREGTNLADSCLRVADCLQFRRARCVVAGCAVIEESARR